MLKNTIKSVNIAKHITQALVGVALVVSLALCVSCYYTASTTTFPTTKTSSTIVTTPPLPTSTTNYPTTPTSITIVPTKTTPSPIPTLTAIQKSIIKGQFSSYQVALSPDGRYVLIGDEQHNIITFAGADGVVIWNNTLMKDLKETEMESGAIASNGSLIVVGGQDSEIFVFSKEKKLLWQTDVPGELQVAVTDTGDKVFAAGIDSLHAYDRIGSLLWSQKVATRGWNIWGISTTPDGSCILLQTNSDIILLDSKGQETNWFDIAEGNSLVSGALSPNGKQFVVGFTEQNNHYVALYSVGSDQLWRKKVENYVAVDIDDRGFVFASTRGGNNYIWDNEGNLLSTWTNGGLNIDVARDGKTCIVGEFPQATIYTLK